MDLSNKTALVTGGGRGIGRGVVDIFLEQGAQVVIAQRSPLDDDLAADPRVMFLAADLSAEADFSPLVEKAVRASGQLDVLVNCAGVMTEREPADVTAADWTTLMSVNLRTPLFLAQAALPHLAGGGSIVNIGSVEALSANPGHAVYAASKGGLHAMTRALAVDLGVHGVRCNAIAPGWIESDLSKAYIASMSDPDAARDELRRLHPAGRLGRPCDIGHTAAFLASDRATFITGQVLVVDGGRTAKLPTPS
ncbi:SDR family oxidoreductase [Brevibacterium antiquum]|uniref:SDR family NAD(P)-dependent oxidoreductase n=1 Tax=Brevibacterium antiquum TaxID=234835 RepID=UPI0018DF8FC2|nr:SDR family oxidoreductase [Brevibacterium antiquum]